MGLATSAAAAIIGVSIFVSIEFMVANVVPTFEDTNDAYKEMKDRAIEQVQTDINITDCTPTAGAITHNVNITVTNIGSTVLKTNDFNVLINGTNQEFTCTETYLYPDKIAYFNVLNLPGKTGTRSVKIVTNNGISDYDEYLLK